MERFTGATPERLTDLSPEQVLALPPEQKALWSQQCREEEDDFAFMLGFVEDLYPLCRRHFKAARGVAGGDLSESTDGPLAAVFDHLLSLVDVFADEPDFLHRFRHAQQRLRKRLERRGVGPEPLAAKPLMRRVAPDAPLSIRYDTAFLECLVRFADDEIKAADGHPDGSAMDLRQERAVSHALMLLCDMIDAFCARRVTEAAQNAA